MKKRITAILLSIATLFTVCSFTGCKNDAPEATRMTVDINPSVEFIVDKDNKVVSATALNDDGSVILAGEAFVGKTSDEAVQLVVSLATETGYIVKGEASADKNNINISVSGDTKFAKDIYEKAEKKVNKFIEDNGINAQIKKAEAAKTEELKKIALKNPSRTEEDVKDKTDEQLIAMIKLDRVETAELLTEEMRDAYFKAKAYYISFAEREETAKIINGMGAIYAKTYKSYDAILKLYSKAIEEMDNARYNTLVSPDSEYQKLLAELRNSKAEVLKERKLVASITVDGEEKVKAEASLKLSEENYDKLVKKVEDLGNKANATWESAITIAKGFETQLKDVQAKFPAEITDKLNAEAKNLETTINNAKTEYFDKFEAAHKGDIEKAEANLKAYKEKLKEQANG